MKPRGATIAAIVAVAILLVLTPACAPAAGQQAFAYLGAPQEIISVVAQFGPFVATPTGYDFLSIETIGDGYVTLVAPATTGWQVMAILGGTAIVPLRVTVTTFEQAEATSVAISVTPISERSRITEAFLIELDRRFRRA